MGSYRQTFLYKLATLVTLLAGETWVHSNHLMTSSRSLLFKDFEELPPCGIQNGFRQVMVLNHVRDNEVFNRNVLILYGIVLCHLEMMVTTLTIDLQMGLGDIPGSLSLAVTAFLAAAHGTLFAPECALRGAVEARVFNRMPHAISQERLESDINADGRMRTFSGDMFDVRFRFTDNEGIPMTVRAQDKMHRFRCALCGTMEFDLEEVSHLLGDNQVFLALVQIAVFAILSKLNGVPSVRFLETREPNTSNVIFLSSEKALERFGEAICKHLYRSCWYVLTLPFESRFQLILAGECPILLILSLNRLKHPIVNDARLCQASHEQARLFLIWIQTVFKCSHEHTLLQAIRIVKRQGNTKPKPQIRSAFFTPVAEARGTQRRFLVAIKQPFH